MMDKYHHCVYTAITFQAVRILYMRTNGKKLCVLFLWRLAPPSSRSSLTLSLTLLGAVEGRTLMCIHKTKRCSPTSLRRRRCVSIEISHLLASIKRLRGDLNTRPWKGKINYLAGGGNDLWSNIVVSCHCVKQKEY